MDAFGYDYPGEDGIQQLLVAPRVKSVETSLKTNHSSATVGWKQQAQTLEVYLKRTSTPRSMLSFVVKESAVMLVSWLLF